MPRINRVSRAKAKRPERPLPEWSLAELRAELDRLGEDSSDLNKWAAFKRKSELQNEFFKRTREDL